MPHPSPFRSTTSLDGEWEFCLDGATAWRRVRVPNPWQAECPDLCESFGLGRYRRPVTLPEGEEVAIRFGAASEIARVRVGGREIGSHEGGYLPFECVVPPDVPRETVLEVDTLLPSIDAGQYPEYSFPEYPHGKQSWYGPLGGLWQSVTVEVRATTHVVHAAIVATVDGRVKVAAEIAKSGADDVLIATVHSPSGAVVGEVRCPAAALVDVELAVEWPALWSPRDPNLYRLELTLARDGTPIDRWCQTFGFRSIEARDGLLLLNGEPIYLRGALDQDYYPHGIATPPSLAFLEDQLRKAKAIGLNCLRCHIKVPDPRYYEVADRLGMLIWTEIPSVARLTERSAERLRDTFAGILRRDGHHPSIVIWTLINEDWGTRLVEDADHRAWLAGFFDQAKVADPTRLVVDNSPCMPNFHVKTDIDDFHYYRGIPERRAEWDKLTAEFAARPAWTFSPHGDAQRTGTEPLILSEFGVWGLPDPAQARQPDGTEPVWMESGPFWGDGTAYPHGIGTRYQALGLDKVFHGFDRFIAAAQWHQWKGLKYQIESIRAHPSIVGYVITEFTDVHWEANGLFDLKRNGRVFLDRFAELNTDAVVLPRFERWAYWNDETVEVPVVAASGGTAVPDGSTLEWSFMVSAGDTERVAALAPCDAATVATLRFSVAPTPGAYDGALSLRVRDPSGLIIAQNEQWLTIYPRPDTAGPTVASPDPDLHTDLGRRHLPLAELEAADVIVTRDLAAADVEAIRRGRHVLVLADGHRPGRRTLRADEHPREPPDMPVVDARPGTPAASHHFFPGLAVVERHGTPWRADWIGNFSWWRDSPTFRGLAGGPMLDLTFDRVVPHHVITGLQPWEWEARVHAGVVVGWVHKPAALICERPFGAGKMVATTFRLFEDPPGADPVADTLLRALIRTAASLPV